MDHRVTANGDLGAVLTIFGMEMRRKMLVVIEPNDDAEKAADFRQGV